MTVIDDRIRDKLIKEINFSLTGLADTDRIEPGKIEGIDYFVEGSVTQIGESFTISMRVVEVNTSRVIYTSRVSIPKYDIVDYSEKLAAAYVSTYGLGMEFYSQTSEWSGTACWSCFRASAENERLKYPAACRGIGCDSRLDSGGYPGVLIPFIKRARLSGRAYQ